MTTRSRFSSAVPVSDIWARGVEHVRGSFRYDPFAHVDMSHRHARTPASGLRRQRLERDKRNRQST